METGFLPLGVDSRDLGRWIQRSRFGRLHSLDLRGQREREGLAPLVSLRTAGGKMLVFYIISGMEMGLQVVNDDDQESPEMGMTKVRESKGPWFSAAHWSRVKGVWQYLAQILIKNCREQDYFISNFSFLYRPLVPRPHVACLTLRISEPQGFSFSDLVNAPSCSPVKAPI